jgi:formamidopyrimidine-DNA glycosylase
MAADVRTNPATSGLTMDLTIGTFNLSHIFHGPRTKHKTKQSSTQIVCRTGRFRLVADGALLGVIQSRDHRSVIAVWPAWFARTRLVATGKGALALMPELPDITLYVEALECRVVGERLEGVRIQSPFLLRTFDPPLESVNGKRICGLRRLGKRIALGLDDDLWLVLHLTIAGRLHWKEPKVKLATKAALAVFTFSNGTLLFTEAGSKRRASLYLVRGQDGLREHDPGGLEPLTATFDEFLNVLRQRNHTLKRALADPHLFSGIGNAYSDEILHRARLSPLALSQKLTTPEGQRLYEGTRTVLVEWIERLRAETGDGWPEKVTAFRPDMAVHGRFGKPCPVCKAPVQRIRYADNETNYCPGCQTGGRILADRSLSRLLKDDWPRHLDDL